MEQNKFCIEVITARPTARFLHTVKFVCKYALFYLTRSPRFMPFGGPGAVARSLRAGLENIKAPRGAVRVAAVLADPDALRWALAKKKSGYFQAVIAGPNVTHNPASDAAIIKDSGIDAVIVPSEWTRRWWISLDSTLESKLYVWPAGVCEAPASSRTGSVIVYIKDEDDAVLSAVRETLQQSKIPYRELRYGRFTPAEYAALLADARALMYLSHTESQGIALFEAWMRDVPTLVWNPGFFSIGGFSWQDPQMSAPYLTPDCGLFFKDAAAFHAQHTVFFTTLADFHPREYMLAHHTDTHAAEQYLAIVHRVLRDIE